MEAGSALRRRGATGFRAGSYSPSALGAIAVMGELNERSQAIYCLGALSRRDLRTKPGVSNRRYKSTR
jgi:hypothetical protein